LWVATTAIFFAEGDYGVFSAILAALGESESVRDSGRSGSGFNPTRSGFQTAGVGPESDPIPPLQLIRRQAWASRICTSP
jgi:hypothetical protein